MPPNTIPEEVLVKASSVRLMKARRDEGGFTSIGDAIELQKAERQYKQAKRRHIKGV